MVTGGVVVAAATVYEHWRGQPVGWRAYALGLITFFVVAAFGMWRSLRREIKDRDRIIGGLQERARPRLSIEHRPDCPLCVHPDITRGWPTYEVEVRNIGPVESLRSVVLEIDSGESTGNLGFPVTVARWPSLNPGAPAQHTTLFRVDEAEQIFVVAGDGQPDCWFPAEEGTITVIAHAEDAAAVAATFAIRRSPEDWTWSLTRVG
jgi:hypothetical protein